MPLLYCRGSPATEGYWTSVPGPSAGDPGKLGHEGDHVYVTHHDGGDTEVFAESVGEMLATLKQANPGT